MLLAHFLFCKSTSCDILPREKIWGKGLISLSKDKNAFAIRLKRLRKERGITQRELAKLSGISYGSIIDYENSRSVPSFKAMVALEQYFEVSGAYLRGETDETAPPSWDDTEVMAEVGAQLPEMLEHIGELLAGASPEMQKLAFDLLVELKHLLNLSDPAIQAAGARMMSVYLLQWNTYLVALERQSPEAQAAALQQAMDELCPRPAKPKAKPPAQP